MYLTCAADASVRQVPKKTTISRTRSSSALKGGESFFFIQGT